MSDFRPIPRIEGYSINTDGIVRNDKTNKIVKSYIKHRKMTVTLNVCGKRIGKSVNTLMKYAFWGIFDDEISLYHINGSKYDCSLVNLRPMNKYELGKISGGQSRRQAVEKLTAEGTSLEIYSSARQAAKANHMSYQTVIDFCNGKIKRKTAVDGNIYRWEV